MLYKSSKGIFGNYSRKQFSNSKDKFDKLLTKNIKFNEHKGWVFFQIFPRTKHSLGLNDQKIPTQTVALTVLNSEVGWVITKQFADADGSPPFSRNVFEFQKKKKLELGHMAWVTAFIIALSKGFQKRANKCPLNMVWSLDQHFKKFPQSSVTAYLPFLQSLCLQCLLILPFLPV